MAKLSEGDINYAKHGGGSGSRHATLEQPLNQTAVQLQINTTAASAAVSSSLSPSSAALSSTTPASSSPASSSSASSTEFTDDSSYIEALRKHCLRLLVRLLEMQAQWLGLPGVQRPDGGLHFPPPVLIPANHSTNQYDAPDSPLAAAATTFGCRVGQWTFTSHRHHRQRSTLPCPLPLLHPLAARPVQRRLPLTWRAHW